MKTLYYEILWDLVCFLNVVVLMMNSYIQNRQGRDIATLKKAGNGSAGPGGTSNA